MSAVRHSTRLSPGVLLAALMLGACDGDARPGQVEIGLPAPDYQAQTLAGEPVALRDLRGRVVLLNGWATWCIPCQREIPALQKLYTDRRDEGLEVVGVNVDVGGADARVREFAESYGVTYPIWRDSEDLFSGIFRAFGLPATYLIGRDGLIRWQHVGELDPTAPSFRTALDAALAESSGAS